MLSQYITILILSKIVQFWRKWKKYFQMLAQLIESHEISECFSSSRNRSQIESEKIKKQFEMLTDASSQSQ